MKFESDHYRNEWFIKEISEETNTFGFITLNTYSNILEEDTEIASVIINDIDIHEKIATFKVIANASNMFKLLEECYEEFDKSNNGFMKKKIENLMLSITD
jgi:hypothetical protein